MFSVFETITGFTAAASWYAWTVIVMFLVLILLMIGLTNAFQLVSKDDDYNETDMGFFIARGFVLLIFFAWLMKP